MKAIKLKEARILTNDEMKSVLEAQEVSGDVMLEQIVPPKETENT